MNIDFNKLLTVTFALFAVIDVVGSLPLLSKLKEKMGGQIHALMATLVSGGLMILFLFTGPILLNILGVDVSSFAVAGSIVIFILGLELVLGLEFFKSDGDAKSGSLVPIAFPLIAGSGTLTAIISLRTKYDQLTILLAIIINLIIVYIVLKSIDFLEKLIGPAGLLAIRKFFGVVLLAIAVKIFASNIGTLIK